MKIEVNQKELDLIIKCLEKYEDEEYGFNYEIEDAEYWAYEEIMIENGYQFSEDGKVDNEEKLNEIIMKNFKTSEAFNEAIEERAKRTVNEFNSERYMILNFIKRLKK